MQNQARETFKLTVTKYSVRDWPDNPKRRARESKLSERDMSAVQQAIWESLCDPLTTDEPLRLAMLNAALQVKYDHMDSLIKSLGLSKESQAAVSQTMREHRERLLTPAEEE